MGRPKLPDYENSRLVLLEYYAFKSEQRRIWIARVRHAAKVNPDLSWEMLAERFNCESHQIYRVCADLPREKDMFATMRNRENRRRRSA